MSERAPISPRSPRAALEPEQLPPPPKRSRGARNPLVVAGNAIFTVVLLLMLGAGGGYFYAKQALEAPGPLAEDRIVNIPRTAGTGDIADILQREGVIDVNRWAFLGSVVAMKARSELKAGEYQFQKRASLRDVIDTMVDRQGRAACADHPGRPDVRADRRAAAGERRALRPGQGNPARRHAAAGNLQIRARHDARAGDPAHAAGAAAR